jgi:hypothetical protein
MTTIGAAVQRQGSGFGGRQFLSLRERVGVKGCPTDYDRAIPIPHPSYGGYWHCDSGLVHLMKLLY